jgi:Uma2 family endonuclease
MRVVIDEHSHYTYPDITIVCGERKFLDNQTDSLLNPSIIIEVLSDSTETYDRGKKFESYRNIASLKEYMLVSTDRKKIELFSKDGNEKWYLSESNGKEGIFIPALSITLSIEDVYEKIDFQ